MPREGIRLNNLNVLLSYRDKKYQVILISLTLKQLLSKQIQAALEFI